MMGSNDTHELRIEVDRHYLDALRSLARSKNTTVPNLVVSYVESAVVAELDAEMIERLGDFEKTALRRLVNNQDV